MYDRFRMHTSWIGKLEKLADEKAQLIRSVFESNGIDLHKLLPRDEQKSRRLTDAQIKRAFWEFLRESQMVHNYVVFYPTESCSTTPGAYPIRVDLTFEDWSGVRKTLEKDEAVVLENFGGSANPLNATQLLASIYPAIQNRNGESPQKKDEEGGQEAVVINLCTMRDELWGAFEPRGPITPSKHSIYSTLFAFAEGQSDTEDEDEPLYTYESL